MSAPLDSLQEKLEAHFARLASRRSGTGFRLFVFEHGLSQSDLIDLSEGLRALAYDRTARERYWLLWAVYATEQGYAYEGDEYWPSFEANTPGWGIGDRSSILPFFKAFQERYDGVIPSGAWANQFKIIAWPITHAILPRFLQMHFAKAVYDLRYQLLSLSTGSPIEIGRVMAAHAHPNSKRFGQFLEQEELCGRIVLAMLHSEQKLEIEPIYESTLSRIVTDLERVRKAREWLNETRNVVTDSFRWARRRSRSSRPRTRDARESSDDQDEKSYPEIRPKLVLRHVGENEWSVIVDIPGLSAILGMVNDETRNFLRQTRCRVQGAPDWKPRGWAASGRRMAVIRTWPDDRQPLIQFERANPLIENILDNDCRLSAGPVWLFKVGRDGLAKEVVTKAVRPGNRYIVISKSDALQDLPGMTRCLIDCDLVSGVHFSMPDHVPDALRRRIESEGLHVARTIRVWPAGLPARNWDGEGRSEWLTTETPCFGVVSDYPVNGYVVYIDDDDGTSVSAKSNGDPSFFRIPPLSTGSHYIDIEVERDGDDKFGGVDAPPEGELILDVRNPEPWRAGTTLQNALLVTTDPYDAYLEDFWENKVQIGISGPPSHEVICTLQLHDYQGNELFSRQVDGAMGLPVSTETWAHEFDHSTRDEGSQWAYLEANSCRVTIDGGEIGACTIHFERRPRPVRWVPTRRNSTVGLRMIDETGMESERAGCEVFDMQTPVRQRRFDSTLFRENVDVHEPGALFVAYAGEFRDSVVVSTGLAGEGLQGLNVSPEVDDLSAGPQALLRGMNALVRWKEAWLAGLLADVRRKKVIERIQTEIWRSLCGSKWMRLEEQYWKAPTDEKALRNLMRGVGPSTSQCVTELRKSNWENLPTFRDVESHFAGMAQTYRLCGDRSHLYGAFWLAVDPARINDEYNQGMESLLQYIWANQYIMRAARFAVLMWRMNRELDG